MRDDLKKAILYDDYDAEPLRRRKVLSRLGYCFRKQRGGNIGESFLILNEINREIQNVKTLENKRGRLSDDLFYFLGVYVSCSPSWA